MRFMEPKIVAAQLLIGLAQAAVENLSRNNINAHDAQHGPVQRRAEPKQRGPAQVGAQHCGGHEAGGQGQLLARPRSPPHCVCTTSRKVEAESTNSTNQLV